MKFTTRILPYGIGPSDPIVQRRAQKVCEYVTKDDRFEVLEKMCEGESSGEVLADLYRNDTFIFKILENEAIFVATCQKVDAYYEYCVSEYMEDMEASEPPVPRFLARF